MILSSVNLEQFVTTTKEKQDLVALIEIDENRSQRWLSAIAGSGTFGALKAEVNSLHVHLEEGQSKEGVDLLVEKKEESQIDGSVVRNRIKPLVEKYQDEIVAAIIDALDTENAPVNVYVVVGAVYIDLIVTADIGGGFRSPVATEAAAAILLMKYKVNPTKSREIDADETVFVGGQSGSDNDNVGNGSGGGAGASRFLFAWSLRRGKSRKHSKGGQSRQHSHYLPWKIGELTNLDKTDQILCGCALPQGFTRDTQLPWTIGELTDLENTDQIAPNPSRPYLLSYTGNSGS